MTADTAAHDRVTRDDLYRRALNAALTGNAASAAVAFRRAADGDDPASIDAVARGIREAIDAARPRTDADCRLIDVMDNIVRAAEAALPVTQPPHHPVRVFEGEQS